MKVVLDALCMERKAEAHAYLKEKLGFPEYYGKNLDALYDCLTELVETELVIVNQSLAAGYFKKTYRVIKKASEDNHGLLLKEETLEEEALKEEVLKEEVLKEEVLKEEVLKEDTEDLKTSELLIENGSPEE